MYKNILFYTNLLYLFKNTQKHPTLHCLINLKHIEYLSFCKVLNRALRTVEHSYHLYNAEAMVNPSKTMTALAVEHFSFDY